MPPGREAPRGGGAAEGGAICFSKFFKPSQLFVGLKYFQLISILLRPLPLGCRGSGSSSYYFLLGRATSGISFSKLAEGDPWPLVKALASSVAGACGVVLNDSCDPLDFAGAVGLARCHQCM